MVLVHKAPRKIFFSFKSVFAPRIGLDPKGTRLSMYPRGGLVLNKSSGHGLGYNESARLREAEFDEALPDSGSKGGITVDDRGWCHID